MDNNSIQEPPRYSRLPLSREQLQKEKRLAFRIIMVAAAGGILGGAAFVIYPDLDFLIADQLLSNDEFILQGEGAWSFVRRAIMWAYGIVYVTMIVGLVQSLRLKNPVWSLYAPQWFYLVACSLAGPLLVTNMILKTYVGRPRPRSVFEYGGSMDFIPVFQAGGKCAENCSFVSGEVASMVMIFAALMLASLKRRWLFAILLFPAWAFSAFLRVGQGAHFPSDTYFAGIFMILIAAGLYRLIVLSPRNILLSDQ